MPEERFVVKGLRHVRAIAAGGDNIVLGAGSSCTVPLDDALAAENHCAIVYRHGGFYVEDLSTSSGTYVDGEAAGNSTRLRDGSSVVLGMTRFSAKVDEAAGKLELTLSPKGFFFDKEKDPILWARTETRFGKFPGLLLTNVAAVLLVGAATPFFFLDWSGERLVVPGPISGVHVRALAESTEADGCDSCHAAFEGTPISKCGTCHEDVISNSHPFGTWSSANCTACHVEHRGDEPRALIARAAAGTCGDCHDPDKQIDPNRHPTPVPIEQVTLSYNTFSHFDHVMRRNVTCDRCHTMESAAAPATAGANLDPRSKEFATVTFETCQVCHAEDAAPETRSGVIFVVRWHGTDGAGTAATGENCLHCHQEVRRKELRQVESIRAEPLFRSTSRSHRKELEEHSRGRQCIECHRQGDVGGGRRLEGKFRHGTHMTTLDVADAADASAKKRLSAECSLCHTDRSSADSLASGLYTGPHPSACDRCHVDADGTPLRLEPVRTGDGERVTRTDFPHRFHVDSKHESLADGCFTCHEFAGPATYDALAITKPDASDCTRCHADHANIAGGSCNGCHLEGDPALRSEPLTRDWPVTGNFSHFTPGHRELTDQGQEGCLRCHGGAEKANTIAEVPIPKESDPLCRDCHVGNKARFHWR